LIPLEKLIGKFIPLPIFGGESCQYVPKDFCPQENFFLSEQRFRILKDVITESQEGYLFVGPHGVGKSFLAYFVACYAWINHFPLIYIVCLFLLKISQDVRFGLIVSIMGKIVAHYSGYTNFITLTVTF
jgi:hypothetical protein